MNDELLSLIEAGDPRKALECVDRAAATGADPWNIHFSLFPLAQRVLNPPFINPHLPKMYRIYRELIPSLREDEIPDLVRFLVKGLCDRYQGDYNPHFLTGLGSVLWVVDRFWKDPQVAMNGLFHYLDFFFSCLRPES